MREKWYVEMQSILKQWLLDFVQNGTKKKPLDIQSADVIHSILCKLTELELLNHAVELLDQFLQILQAEIMNNVPDQTQECHGEGEQ